MYWDIGGMSLKKAAILALYLNRSRTVPVVVFDGTQTRDTRLP